MQKWRQKRVSELITAVAWDLEPSQAQQERTVMKPVGWRRVAVEAERWKEDLALSQWKLSRAGFSKLGPLILGDSYRFFCKCLNQRDCHCLMLMNLALWWQVSGVWNIFLKNGNKQPNLRHFPITEWEHDSTESAFSTTHPCTQWKQTNTTSIPYPKRALLVCNNASMTKSFSPEKLLHCHSRIPNKASKFSSASLLPSAQQLTVCMRPLLL